MGKVPHFTFCFLYCYLIFEAELLSFCCCSEPCQKESAKEKKMVITVLALRSACSARTPGPAVGTLRI